MRAFSRAGLTCLRKIFRCFFMTERIIRCDRVCVSVFASWLDEYVFMLRERNDGMACMHDAH